MPSKSGFCRLNWNSNYFIYSIVGNKVFKLLASSTESIKILDTPPEEAFFSTNKTWYEDFISCLENYCKNINKISGKSTNKEISNNENEDIFSLKYISFTLTRQYFTFLGIILNTRYGEEYLIKNKFYPFINSLVTQKGTFDHLIELLINNINYESQLSLNFINQILSNGTTELKKITLLHLKCLISDGKELNWSLLTNLESVCSNPNLEYLLVDILEILSNSAEEFREYSTTIIPFIEKIKNKSKLIISLNNNKELIDFSKKYVQNEIKQINTKALVQEYSIQMNEDMIRSFNYVDEDNIDNAFITISLPKIKDPYSNKAEYFWLKQLPFTFNIVIMENFGHKSYDQILCDSYLDYENENLFLKCIIKQKILLNIQKDCLKLSCNFGEKMLDSTGKISIQNNMLNFELKDFKYLKKVRNILF